MLEYLILNITKVEKNFRTIIVKEASKKKGVGRPVTGNLPLVFNGMTIELSLKDNFVLDYQLQLTSRNIAILDKNHEDIRKYSEALNRHAVLKGHKCGWSVAEQNLDKIYDMLPFKEADLVHKSLVDNPLDEKRLACISRTIREIARGHSEISYPLDKFLYYFERVEKMGSYEPIGVGNKLKVIQDSCYSYTNGVLYDKEIYEMEQEIRNNILSRKDNLYDLMTEDEIKRFIASAKDRGLAEEQINVVNCMQTNEPTIITGGAGCGKTTVIKTLIDCYSVFYNKEFVLLVAPTGRASRRLAEKTALPASTIHKALRKTPNDNYVYYNENRPLPHRVIIVDESSMLDTELMKALLSAAEASAKIIFVGDHQQLQPVGYGEPFFDFMNPEDKDLYLHIFRLMLNHRQDEGTDILRAAQEALEGKEIHSGEGVIVKHITYEEIGNYLTVDRNTQIISPYHKLNDEINTYLCRAREDEHFTVGDKVMTIRNSDDYCNGDIGYVDRFTEEGIVLSIEGREVTVPFEDSGDIVLAYAITVHKMQGSEADCVKVFIPNGDRCINPRMMYTAITRARKQLELYYYDEPVAVSMETEKQMPMSA